MKKLLLLATATLTAASLCIDAQTAASDDMTAVEYTYDASGNRILRSIKGMKDGPVKISAQSDSLAKVSVSPNPTAGLTMIEFSEEGTTATAMSLYSLEGTHLKDWSAFCEPMQIDLTTYPSGWYVIYVLMEETVESVKILKQ